MKDKFLSEGETTEGTESEKNESEGREKKIGQKRTKQKGERREKRKKNMEVRLLSMCPKNTAKKNVSLSLTIANKMKSSNKR